MARGLRAAPGGISMSLPSGYPKLRFMNIGGATRWPGDDAAAIGAPTAHCADDDGYPLTRQPYVR
jgi:hypothetical protein